MDNEQKASFRSVYPPGMKIFEEGEERNCAYIIERGSVEISRIKDGKEVPLVRLGEGEICGEMALTDAGKRSASATAVEETEVLVITQEMLRERMSNMDPIVALLMRLLVDRYRLARYISPDSPPDEQEIETVTSTESAALSPLKYLSEQHDMAIQELKMEKEIRRAIDANEFVPHLQPILTLPEKKLAGFEALIRWEHPEKGMIPPFEFIPVAERTHVVQYLDMLMLKQACKLVPEFQNIMGEAAENLFISVNLSGVHFGKHDVVSDVKEIINDSGVDPKHIKLEITESALIGDPTMAADVLANLKELGIGIALDDFGTGYSSLGYLHKFAIDEIKIDRAFVQQIHTDAKSLDIVRAIVGLAHTFQQKIIAEGIEQESEVIALTGLGCEYGQGYLFSKPLSVTDAKIFAENKASS